MHGHLDSMTALRRLALFAGVLLLGTLLAAPALAESHRARRAVDDGRVSVHVHEAGKRGRGHGARHRDDHRYRGHDRRYRHDHDDSHYRERYRRRGHRGHRGHHGHYRDYGHHDRWSGHRGGRPGLVFDVPLRLRYRDHGHYARWYAGDYWYGDHRHRHRVYHFPYNTRYGMSYRAYEYCDGRRLDRAYVSYDDPRFSIHLRF